MLPRHVYVHVPFCARRCSYCDFSIAVRRIVPWAEYVDALRRELTSRFGAGGPWVADTLYLGGGTPSRLGGDGVAALLAALRERIALAPDAEVTLEVNPEDVTAEVVAGWMGAGINRLSLGVQSFDDTVLAWMHRSHDAAAVTRAVRAVRGAGISNLSFDLIFALPPEVKRSWDSDVARALELGPDHLSLYGLTIEPRTPLGRWWDRQIVTQAPEERYEAEFMFAHHALADAGFEHYEVSNFGRAGFHARHNSAYWSGAAYAGLGPSAHEYDGCVRRWNTAGYVDWARRLAAGGDPVDGSERLTPENREAERIYLGLRTAGGLAATGPELARARPWIDAGWARLGEGGGGQLVLTPQGWLRLDALAADLTLVRSRY